MKINIEFDLNNENDRKTYENYLNIKTLKEEYSKDMNNIIKEINTLVKMWKLEHFVPIKNLNDDLNYILKICNEVIIKLNK